MSEITEQITKARKPQPRYPVLKEIANRFSPRYFSNDPIPESDLNSIFEAARLAPSGRNYQPWNFYWTRSGTETFDKLYASLPLNNKWAGNASIFIVCSYLEKNENTVNEFALYDLGAAVISLILQADNLGYCARQMGLFDKTQTAKIIQAREFEIPFIIIALGKIGDYSKASEELINKDLTTSLRKLSIALEI